MKEPVITKENISDQITLEDKHRFDVKTTLGLAEGGDFYVKIEFDNLDIESMRLLNDLYKKPERIKINSELIRQEGYKIDYIVVEKFSATNSGVMVWDCYSDDPELYNFNL